MIWPNSINIWQELAKKFLVKYFHPVHNERGNVIPLSSKPMKKLYETWERFKDLLKQ